MFNTKSRSKPRSAPSVTPPHQQPSATAQRKPPLTKGFKIAVASVAVIGVALTFGLPEVLKMMQPAPVIEQPTKIDLAVAPTPEELAPTPTPVPVTPPDPALSGASSAEPCQLYRGYIEGGRNTSDLLAKKERDLALEILGEMGCLNGTDSVRSIRAAHPDARLLASGRATPEMYRQAINQSEPDCRGASAPIEQLVRQEHWEQAASEFQRISSTTCLGPTPLGGYYGFSSPRWDIGTLVAKNVDAMSLIQITLIRGVPGCLPLVYEVIDIPASASQWDREDALMRIRSIGKATGCLAL